MISGSDSKTFHIIVGAAFLIIFLSIHFLEADGGQAGDEVFKKTAKTHPEDEEADFLAQMEALEKDAQNYDREAVRLFEEGRYQEAQGMWQKAIEIMEQPGMEHRKKPVIPGDEEGEESFLPDVKGETDLGAIEEKYELGISLFEEKEYTASKTVFEEIDSVHPGYEDTANYLLVIEELMAREKGEGEPALEEGVEESEAALPAMEKKSPAEEQWKKTLEESRAGFRRESEEKVRPLYQQGVEQYKNKEFEQAKASFEQVEVICPKYKSTVQYLARIEEFLRRDQKRRQQEERRAGELAKRQEEEDLRKSVQEKEIQQVKELEAKAEPLYQQGIEQYKARKLEQAKSSFDAVQMIYPDYKFTTRYLQELDQDIREEERQRIEQELKLEALARQKQQEEWKQTLEESERMRQEKLEDEAETVYQKACAFYREGNLEKARFYFGEVKEILPEYKSTVKYLLRIDEDIAREKERRLQQTRYQKLLESLKERQQQQSRGGEEDQGSQRKLKGEAERLYQQAKNYYKSREFKKAKQYFREVSKILPDYQSTEKYLARIDEDIKNEEQYQKAQRKRVYERQIQEKRLFAQGQTQEESTARLKKRKELQETLERIKDERQRRLDKRLGFIYEEAQGYYQARLPEMAQERFEEIQRISPGYKSTEEYLSRIARDIAREEQRRREKSFRQSPVIEPSVDEEISKTETVRSAAHSLEKEISSLYREAILLFRHKYYAEAKEKFEMVRQSSPDYKSTGTYLERITQEMTKQQMRQTENQHEDLQRKVREEKLSQKNVHVSSVRFISADGEGHDDLTAGLSEQDKSLIQKAQQKRRTQIQEEAEKKYHEALGFYESADFVSAKQKLIEVEALCPGYQQTRDHLSHIDEDIEKQRQYAHGEPVGKPHGRDDTQRDLTGQFQRKAEELFQHALKLYEGGQWVQARQKLMEVDRLVPGYKTTKDLLDQIDRKLSQSVQQKEVKRLPESSRDQMAAKTTKPIPEELVHDEGMQKIQEQLTKVREKRQKIQQERSAKLAQSYEEAVGLYNSGMLQEAKDLLAEIDHVHSGYKKTKYYLGKIEKRLKKIQAAKQQGNLAVAPSVHVRTKTQVIAEALDAVEARR